MSFSACVVSRRTPGTAVDDEPLGMLGDLRVEVVEEHPQRRLRLPGAARSATCLAARGWR